MVVPAGSGPGHPVDPETPVAGLPLLRRIALAAARAGFGPVLVHSGIGARGLEGTAATPLGEAGMPPPAGRRRVVVMPANIVPQPQWLRSLLDRPVEGETLYADEVGVSMVETEDLQRLLVAAERCGSVAALATALRRLYPRAPRALEGDGRFPLGAARDVPKAERWLLRSLIKDSEGFMSRHFERRLSLALTRRLVATRITPNAMTVVSLAVGLAAAPFFLSPAPGWQLAGALIFLVHSILDGCDGELARLKFLESSGGAILDFWGDNLVHVAVFGCMAVGWSLAAGSAWPLWLGAVAIASALVAAGAVAPHILAPAPTGAGASAGARLADALSHRDFIYLVILLSAVGRAAWFVALAAVGTPIFVAVRLWADRSRREG